MPQNLVLNNLTRRRARLMGEIEAATRLIRVQKKELATIDAMIWLVDANVQPSKIKGIRGVARLEGFRQGDLTRLTYGALREGGRPMSAVEVADQIIEARPIEDYAELLKRVRANLMRLTHEGRVVRSGRHKARLWALENR